MDIGTHEGATTPETMSIRAYARHRGVSATAVVKAIRSGRLAGCLVDTPLGKQIGDADLADREWDSNTDLSRAPGYVKGRAAGRPGDAPPAPKMGTALTLLEASALEKEWKAKLAELDYLQRTEGLVDARVWEANLVDAYTRARTKLLGVVAKARTAIPHLTRPDLLILDGLIRGALEELAEDERPDTPSEERGLKHG